MAVVPPPGPGRFGGAVHYWAFGTTLMMGDGRPAARYSFGQVGIISHATA